MKDSCFLCGKSNVKDFQPIESQVTTSQKPVSSVLQHLANCIKLKLVFDSGVILCAKCFQELESYDKLMVDLLTKQKKLAKRLQLTLKSKLDAEEQDAEVESNENFNADDVEEDIAEDGQLADVFNPGLDVKEEFIAVDDKVIVIGTDTENPHDESLINEDAQLDNENIEIDEDNDGMDQTNDDDDDDEDYMARPKRHKPECVACGEIFKTKHQLQNHIAVVHKQKTYSCNICGLVRRDEEYLELHMNLHEGKTENECRYCDKKFSRPMNTLRHMRKHWDKKKFQCEKCGERFSLDNMLYNHKQRHEAEENPLICSICNQSFKSRKTFNHHMIIHQENRPRHHCQLCSKSFTERYTLKMHMKTHGEILPGRHHPEEQQRETEAAVIALVTESPKDFSCVICNAKFYSKDTLELHLQREHDVILK